MTFSEFFKIPDTPNRYWQIGTLVGFVFLAIVYSIIGFSYKQKYAQFTSNPDSVKALIGIRNHDISTKLGTLKQNNMCVTSNIIQRINPYTAFNDTNDSLVNWRPLTVRLAGYLGGIHTARDGVFDMNNGIQRALERGARAFVFEIDYLDISPCKPVLIHRDSKGYKRSLNTGSIYDGCNSLAKDAFSNKNNENYDPVLIILYFRRIPDGIKQQDDYFRAVARSLAPLSTEHLSEIGGKISTSCHNESDLFYTSIKLLQKKFIVLTNYDTTQITPPPNNKDNLHFWTHARIFQDPSGIDSSIGSSSPSGTGKKYAFVASAQQLLNMPSSDIDKYVKNNSNGNQTPSSTTFKIALSDVEHSFSPEEVDKLLNTLGVQCVPLDIIRLAETDNYEKSISLNANTIPRDLSDLFLRKNPKDVLAFWSYGGWSRKNTTGLSPVVNVPPQINGYISAVSISPRAPPASTNSNGGILNIQS